MTSKISSVEEFLDAIRKGNFFDECLLYMSVVGIFRDPGGWVFELKFLLFYLMLAYFFAASLVWMVQSWNGVETFVAHDLFIPAIQFLCIGLHYKINAKQIRQLIQNYKKRPVFKDPVADEEVAVVKLRVRNYMTTYKTMGTLCAIMMCVRPLISANEQHSHPWYDACNIGHLYCYIGTLLWQDLCTVNTLLYCYINDATYVSFMLDVYMQLVRLRHRIKKIVIAEGIREEDVLDELQLIGRQHVFILRYIKDINRLCSLPILIELLASIVNICLGSFLLTVEGVPDLKSFIQFSTYALGVCAQSFLYCVGGQMVIDECYKIGDEVYYLNWWKATMTRVRRNLSLVIMRAQNSDGVSIAGLTTVNVALSLYVFKTAGSYYMMINQLYHKDEV